MLEESHEWGGLGLFLQEGRAGFAMAAVEHGPGTVG